MASFVPGPIGRALAPGQSSELDHLIRLLWSNEWLLSELRALAGWLGEALDYLSEPGCDPRLGSDLVRHLTRKHREALGHLRENRRELRRLVG
ncbi:MAG: hypothetical protein WKF75_13755 [Singulisphaera sp.]